jgi:hypothetical protein
MPNATLVCSARIALPMAAFFSAHDAHSDHLSMPFQIDPRSKLRSTGAGGFVRSRYAVRIGFHDLFDSWTLAHWLLRSLTTLDA